MVRIERESDRRRKKEKWQTCWCCRDSKERAEWRRLQRKKLEQTGPAEKERVASVPQREQLANARAPLPKGKGQSRLSRVPDHEGGER